MSNTPSPYLQDPARDKRVVAGSAVGSEENSPSCEMDCNTTLNISENRGSEEYGKQPPKKIYSFRLLQYTHWIILICLKVL